MATIEERATQYFRRIYQGEQDNIYLSLVEIATEQDRIARQEERERCIKMAQDAVCKVCASCYNISNCKKNGCGFFNGIRKSINNEKD